jgi:hypothetical protein
MKGYAHLFVAGVEIYQDINWENINQVWDGWSRLVMIPVSHTGGREFKSLPIHCLCSTLILKCQFIEYLQSV